jgi:hypothetical protein
MSTLIVFLVQPDGLYWTPVYFCTSRIYVITMSESYRCRTERYKLTIFVCLKSLCEQFFHISFSALMTLTRLNGREDMKRNEHGLIQSVAAPVSRLRFKEFSSQSRMADQSTVTKPSLIHFQPSSPSRDSNVSSILQEDLEKLAWNNNRF